MALWGGRFEKDMDQIVKEFNASIGFDQRMYNEDIDGSIAHVTMLAAQGIVTEEESRQIIDGLERIREKIRSGEIVFTVEDEDIHMGIESRLIEEIGEVGKKLHTARSRNDQCQVDGRLYLKEQIRAIVAELIELEEVILRKADQYAEEITVGFTHIQHAQPITIGFVFMAYFQMFRRDIERLTDTYERMDLCPLGACALAGTTFPTDRARTAELLGFRAPTENAMDSVSDRDYAIEFLSDASISMMHISRWAEEFAWWNTSEFSYIAIDDSFCTGSSIMPQKKNPDMAELLRGKSGRVYGDLMQMLTVLKGTPLAYNKDFQEDKEGLFDAVDTWKACIQIFTKMLDKTEFRMDQIEKQLSKGFLNATDVAEHLAMEGIPFREAHNIVGRMVKACEERGCQLEELDEESLRSIDSRLSRKALGDISIPACVSARKSFGGTAPDEVRRQIRVGRSWLESLKN
ncbi:argininosuccinate lyase [Hornefia butyriciproducens]|uniref:argininosuccinate lyase n=1 Tax=Hornefia butyriciproducens TaxID=2652293 RepID=UPI0023F47FA0|nr:argininosuccinate lyase [Hornefia butyriciproducens]MCI7413575.1 argininosuccinate lyase [Clostridiales bacterium]MCI7679535.1 argininosuccinate lyase [Clostridiales bacterium]MDD6298824.1 argininosuccinate lyase [Hornefia butyriciproducens]MDD7019402.1 argininosuccinate lyase [Hornefia butyriciproducens]MDY2990874.1 argininosuccinate lyase [Hornefia butyriciproducens]